LQGRGHDPRGARDPSRAGGRDGRPHVSDIVSDMTPSAETLPPTPAPEAAPAPGVDPELEPRVEVRREEPEEREEEPEAPLDPAAARREALDKHFLDVVEFERVRDIVSRHCSTALGRKVLRRMTPLRAREPAQLCL